MAGIVLVWDMDQTLIGNNVDTNDLLFNPKALEVLKRAIELRHSKVAGIFLFTNNPADTLINLFHIKLAYKLRVPYVFDGIMTATDSSRDIGLYKRLVDVKELMERASLDITNLENRVYFFDDVPNHVIRTELPDDHYIQITPPFTALSVDSTDYTPINTALTMAGGSKKKQRKTKKWRRSTKHIVSHKNIRKNRV